MRQLYYFRFWAVGSAVSSHPSRQLSTECMPAGRRTVRGPRGGRVRGHRLTREQSTTILRALQTAQPDTDAPLDALGAFLLASLGNGPSEWDCILSMSSGGYPMREVISWRARGICQGSAHRFSTWIRSDVKSRDRSMTRGLRTLWDSLLRTSRSAQSADEIAARQGHVERPPSPPEEGTSTLTKVVRQPVCYNRFCQC